MGQSPIESGLGFGPPASVAGQTGLPGRQQPGDDRRTAIGRRNSLSDDALGIRPKPLTAYETATGTLPTAGSLRVRAGSHRQRWTNSIRLSSWSDLAFGFRRRSTVTHLCTLRPEVSLHARALRANFNRPSSASSHHYEESLLQLDAVDDEVEGAGLFVAQEDADRTDPGGVEADAGLVAAVGTGDEAGDR